MTTGTWLNEGEIKQVRVAARTFDWIETAPDLMKKADALFRASKLKKTAVLYSRLARIPLKADQVELAKKRAAKENPADSKSATSGKATGLK